MALTAPPLQIAAGPEAGYYLCPYDYDATDRRGSSLECFTGYGKEASGKIIDIIAGLPAQKVLFLMSTQFPDALDTDVTYGSPYFREKFVEKLMALPGRCETPHPILHAALALRLALVLP